MTTFSRRFLLCAVAYVVIGMMLGIQMGAEEDFTLSPLHGHLNLIGWATMALFAFYYNAVPAAAEGRLAQIHFWVAQSGLIIMIPGLYMVLQENASGLPLLIIGELLTALSMLIFGTTVLRNKAA